MYLARASKPRDLKLERRVCAPLGRHFGRIALLFPLLLARNDIQAQNGAKHRIYVSVLNEQGQPLEGVIIEGRLSTTPLCKAVSDAHGQATLRGCEFKTEMQITASLRGYASALTNLPSTDTDEVQICLSKATSVRQDVTVHADSQNQLATGTSSESKVPVEVATQGPLRPNTLVDALPLIPGVIRTPDGRVQIDGQDEEHSNLLINSVTVNDPATGDFGLSVRVDILKVMQSPFLAQYGSFTAGVVSAETRRGGEKWAYNLNDPLPDFRIRSGHLVGLRDASPRLNFGGPLLLNRLYLLEGSEYLIDKAEVRTLPFPQDESRSEALNSFTQIDALLGDRNSVTGTLHFAPHTLQYANLNHFDPEPVTPNADYQEDTGTISERFALGGGLLASTFAGTRVATSVEGQSQGQMLLTPQGNSGRYFGHRPTGQGVRESGRSGENRAD
jgi:hypothetical protein